MNIPTVEALQSIQSYDNGEILIYLHKVYPELLCDYRRTDSGVNRVLVRTSVADKLAQVNLKLKTYDPHLQRKNYVGIFSTNIYRKHGSKF